VATPYPEWNNERLRAYLEAQRFEVLNVEGDPGAAAAGNQGINDQSPESVVEFAARADGVPFMVEELVAAALSSGALVAKAESWRVRERAESLVPRRRRAGGVGG
jgi:maleate cis-trans isomerase